MKNQQGAPEALRLADSLELCWGDSRLDEAAAGLRRLHAENERLASLVEAQQPAPSAAAFDEHGFRDWVLRNMPDDTIIGSSAWWADHLASWAKRFVKAAPQPSPTPQADSQPAPVWDGCTDPYNCKRCMTHPSHRDGMEHAGIPAHAVARAARAPADSVTAPAGGEIDRLRAALVYVAFALHGKPQYMLAEGITLIDGDTVRVSRDGWTVEASVNPARATQPAQAADSVLEDAHALLQEVAACFTRDDDLPDNLLPRIDAVLAARKQGGAT